jgi:hypothetical protein
MGPLRRSALSVKLKYVDSNHAYYLDGKRCKGVTSCAKIGTDTYSLEQWKLRQVVAGLRAKPELLAVSDELVAAGSDSDVVSAALDAAGTHLAAEAGTAAHSLSERSDRGEEITDEDEQRKADHWKGALKSAGLQIVPDLMERVIVHPEQRICGRFDRLARRISDGKLVIVDLKTGNSARRYPHSVATQMAMYVNAPLMGTIWEGDSGETSEFEPLPGDLDKNTGYMVHLPDDGEVAVYGVNVLMGWKVCQQVIFPALRWQATKNEKLLRRVG